MGVPAGGVLVGAGGEPLVAFTCNANGSSPRPPARLSAGTVDVLHAPGVGCQPETLKHSPLLPCCGEGEGWKKW